MAQWPPLFPYTIGCEVAKDTIVDANATVLLGRRALVL